MSPDPLSRRWGLGTRLPELRETLHPVSLVPRLSRGTRICIAWSLVSFVRKHDVIKIGQKQKGNVCALFKGGRN